MHKYTITDKDLNMSHTIHGAKLPIKVLVERWMNSEPYQRSKVERFGKILIAF